MFTPAPPKVLPPLGSPDLKLEEGLLHMYMYIHLFHYIICIHVHRYNWQSILRQIRISHRLNGLILVSLFIYLCVFVFVLYEFILVILTTQGRETSRIITPLSWKSEKKVVELVQLPYPDLTSFILIYVLHLFAEADFLPPPPPEVDENSKNISSGEGVVYFHVKSVPVSMSVKSLKLGKSTVTALNYE